MFVFAATLWVHRDGGIESSYKLHFPWFIKAGTPAISQSSVSIPAHDRVGQLDMSSLCWAKH